jgi:hypothetical protein
MVRLLMPKQAPIVPRPPAPGIWIGALALIAVTGMLVFALATGHWSMN